MGIPCAKLFHHRAPDEQGGAAKRQGETELAHAGQQQAEPGVVFDGEAAADPAVPWVVVVECALEAGDIWRGGGKGGGDAAQLVGVGRVLRVVDADNVPGGVVERVIHRARLGARRAVGDGDDTHPGWQRSAVQQVASLAVRLFQHQQGFQSVARVVEPFQPFEQRFSDAILPEQGDEQGDCGQCVFGDLLCLGVRSGQMRDGCGAFHQAGQHQCGKSDHEQGVERRVGPDRHGTRQNCGSEGQTKGPYPPPLPGPGGKGSVHPCRGTVGEGGSMGGLHRTQDLVAIRDHRTHRPGRGGEGAANFVKVLGPGGGEDEAAVATLPGHALVAQAKRGIEQVRQGRVRRDQGQVDTGQSGRAGQAFGEGDPAQPARAALAAKGGDRDGRAA